MNKTKITTICNLVCAVLLLATLVTLFLPFWTCPGCKTHKDVEKGVSIAEYLWLPKHHSPVTSELTEMYRNIYGHDYIDPATGKKLTFKADYIMPAMLTVFIGSIAGIAGCVVYRKKFFMAAIPLVVGVAGIIGHLSYPALQVGHNRTLHFILFTVVIATAAISLLFGLISTIREKMLKKRSAQNSAT